MLKHSNASVRIFFRNLTLLLPFYSVKIFWGTCTHSLSITSVTCVIFIKIQAQKSFSACRFYNINIPKELPLTRALFWNSISGSCMLPQNKDNLH